MTYGELLEREPGDDDHEEIELERLVPSAGSDEETEEEAAPASLMDFVSALTALPSTVLLLPS